MTESRWPILTEFFEEQLDEAERVLRVGREGKHADDPSLHKTADHNFCHADEHIRSMGPCLDNIDSCTGARHIIHAILRLFFTDRAAQRGNLG